VLRVLDEWVLARSAPAPARACACALHLLCRDAGFLHDAGMMCWPGCVCSVLLLACARALQARLGVSDPAHMRVAALAGCCDE